MSRHLTILVTWMLLLAMCFSSVAAQFGVPKKAESTEGTNEANEELRDLMEKGVEVSADVIRSLMEVNGDLDEQQAIDIAYLLQELQKDPETVMLLNEMKTGTGKQMYEEFTGAGGMSARELVEAMAISLEELKMLDYLFQDPQKAFVEMNQEGLIEDHMVDVYKNDPQLLEDDTRKSVFFQFISFGAAAGYL